MKIRQVAQLIIDLTVYLDTQNLLEQGLRHNEIYYGWTRNTIISLTKKQPIADSNV